MANVLVFTLVFPPDGVSTAQIMGELAADLARAGHSVSAVTTQPHYNRDDIALAAQPLTPMWAGLLFRSSYRGIPVVHVRVPPKRGGIRARLRGWLMFHILGVIAALRLVPRPNVIIVPSPLLSAGAAAWFLCKWTGAHYVYNVQEMYPDLAIQSGRLHNPALIFVLRLLERFVYRTAAEITVITRGMRDKLLARGLSPAKVHFIPNFVDVEDLVPLSRSNSFSREHGLDAHFVVTYAGNIGLAQGVDVLLDAAAHLREERKILFLIVGDGAAREALLRQAQSLQLSNVRFLEHQPYARVPEIYASSDLCAATLLGAVASDAIPSKVYRIMACARPVLAIASPESELATVVREAGAGVIAAPDGAVLATVIRDYLSQSPSSRAEHGRAGREYVLKHVSRQRVTAEYESLVARVARGPQGHPRGFDRS